MVIQKNKRGVIVIAKIITVLEMGLVYTPLVLAVWLTSSLLRYNDIALEASFGLGCALQARLLTLGIPFLLSMPLVSLTGLIVGCITGFLHAILELERVITGIIVVSAFFSINLILSEAGTNLSQSITLFSPLPAIIPGATIHKIIILSLLITGIFYFIRWMLTTQVGLVMHAVGYNPNLVTALGKSPSWYQIATFALAHSLSAITGSLFVQYLGFYSLSLSTGILPIAFTALMLSRVFKKGFGVELIIGSCLYQIVLTITLSLNLPYSAELNRLITALLLVVLIITQRRVLHA